MPSTNDWRRSCSTNSRAFWKLGVPGPIWSTSSPNVWWSFDAGAERCAGFFDVIDPLKDLVSVQRLNAPQVIMLGQELPQIFPDLFVWFKFNQSKCLSSINQFHLWDSFMFNSSINVLKFHQFHLLYSFCFSINHFEHFNLIRKVTGCRNSPGEHRKVHSSGTTHGPSDLSQERWFVYRGGRWKKK